MVLEEGVIEGRKTFSNMLKYIRMGPVQALGLPEPALRPVGMPAQ